MARAQYPGHPGSGGNGPRVWGIPRVHWSFVTSVFIRRFSQTTGISIYRMNNGIFLQVLMKFSLIRFSWGLCFWFRGFVFCFLAFVFFVFVNLRTAL